MQKIFTSTVVKAAYVLAFFLLGISAKTNAQLAAGALSFDGVDDYVNVPSVNILNQLPLTVEAWVKPDLRTDGTSLADFGNNVISNDLTSQYGTGFGVVVLPSNVSGIIVAYNDGFRYISAPLTAGTWFHVSVVYTPGNVKTYLNGNLLESYNFTQSYTSSSSLIRIGKYNDDNSLGTKRYFKGDVDEVRIWNRALCQGEIMNNMNCEVSLPQNDLYSYYKFNVGLIGLLNSLLATLPDVSGNNNDGTLNNFALTGVLSNWVAGKASGTCNSFTVPPATITMGGSTTICQNDSVLMTANSANAYQWYNFGVAIQGATSQTYYAKQTGEYTVAVTTGNCTITSAVQNITVNPIPSIFINATSTSICAGIPVSMSLNGSNDAINAASFNSVNNNDYVTIAHQSQLNPSAITVEAWVRPSTQSGGDKGIIMKLPASNSGQVGYGLRLTSNNRFQFIIGSIGNEVFAQSAVQTIGPWYHLTGTYDGNVIRLYINGTLAGSAVATGALTSTAPIIVGNSNTMNQPFKGTIDELRIWNNVKTGTQISCDYKIAADPTSSNLVGYWRMNTASGTTTPDITTYHNDGVIANTATLVASTASVGNTYRWEAAAGLTNLNNACVTITPTATTTYKGIATNSYGCSAKDSVTVTVFPSGQTFNVTGGGTYCIGGPGLPIGLNGSQVGISYQLKKGAVNVGGLVAGTGSPITIGLATETGSYTVIALNNNCTNTMSGSAIVTAVSAPEINLISKTNPVCNGDSTGAIDLNVSGGTSPRTYTWNNIVASEDLSNVPAGTYILKVSDLNGCTDADTFTLTEPTAPIMGAVVSDVTCNGLTNGSVSLTTGGTAPYIYTWSNSANTKNVSNLAPGAYHVSVEDATGCISNKTYTVAEPGVLSPVLSPVNISCGGNLDGAVNMTVTGGTAPYTYLWSNNATTKNISGLAAGTYSVDVTDAHGCNAGASATVTQGVALSVNGVATDVTCFGANNGSIQLTPATGMAPYTYVWNDNNTAQNRSNLAPGTYSVMVTDSRNCTTSGSYTISQSASALTTSVAKTNVLCNNASNGAVDLTVNGGTAPYIYTWSNSATTQDLSAIPAGTYSVTVKDAKNCIVSTSATVSEPAVLELSAAVTKAYCGNATGDIDLTVSGGTTPYTYTWNNSAATQDLNNVHAGNYSVTVTDANGCSANGSYTIGDTSSMNLAGTVTNPICGGQSNGSITLTINGGIAPFTYAWDDNATTQNRTQLAAGTYSVVVTDDGGCSVPATFTVEEPAPITIVGDVLNASCNAASEAGSSINDGAIYLTLDGGTAPYSFVWTDTAYYDNTQDIEFLGAGTYHVTVTDDNGCTASESFVVTEPALINIAANVTNVGCNNAPGAITTVVTGGNAPYFYEWSNNEPTDYITDLTAGTYTLTVYDDWGCVSTGTYQVGADSLTLSKTVANATCNNAANGAIDVTASSSSFPVTYSWSNSATTQDLNNIPAGTYTLTATNATGCTATLTATVQQPAAITASATSTNAYCGSNTGTVALTVNGGTAPYTYHWNNNAATKDLNGVVAGNYTVTITDANGCTATASATVGQTSANIVATASATNATCGNNNGAITLSITGGTAPFTYVWNNSANSQNLSGLGAGNYSVIVTDANGCTATAAATVNQAGSNITATATAANTICTANNGSITLAITGGTAPYTYQWSNNATTQNISALSAGSYSVVITDANGCGANASATVSQSSSNISLATTVANTTCTANNGGITLTVSGGTAPYTYLWSNNAATQNLSNLSAGNYSVTVTDANGCTKTTSATVGQATANITATASATNTTCGNNNGAINLTVTGGTAPYTYNWGNNITTQNRTNLAAGSYTVTVTDANGCTKTATAAIGQSQPISITATATNATCGSNNGSVNLTVSNATSPVSYAWSNNATTQNLSNVGAGTYSVTVTDANNCTATGTYTITSFDTSAPVIAGPVSGSTVTQNPTAPALGFNVFVQNNASLAGSQTEGAVAMGGNLVLAGNYTVSANTAGTFQVSGVPVTLVVGGLVNYQGSNTLQVNQNGYVKIGDSTGSKVWYKDQNNAYSPIRITNGNNYNSSSRINMQANAQQLGNVSSTNNPVFQGNVINFAAAFTQMKASATGMGTMTDNAALTNANGNPIAHTNLPTQVKINLATGTNVLNLNASDLNAVQNFTYNQQPAANRILVINVNAPGSFAWNVWNSGGIGSSNSPYIIYNFYNTTSLTVQGNGSVYGTLFAPYANINKTNSQNIAGQIIGQSYTKTGGSDLNSNFAATITSGTSSTIAANSTANRNTSTTACSYTVSGNEFTATAIDNCGTPSVNYVLTGATTGTGTNLAGVALNKGTTTITWNATDGTNTSNYSFNVTVADTVKPVALVKNITISLDANGNATITPQSVDNGSYDNCSNITYALSKANFNATNLGANTVTLTITDGSNNTASATATVTVVDNAAPVITCPAAITISCSANATPSKTGTATATDNNGTPVVTYTDVTTGNTIVRTWKATDASNNISTCVQTITIVPVAATAAATNITCNGATNGAIALTVNNGTAPYIYNWGNNVTTQNRSNLAAGTYNVTVTDATGCTATASATITQPSAIVATATATNTTCSANNGTINLSVSGGTAPYTYNWGNNVTTQNRTNLSAGTYTVTVTDANGCTKTATATVGQSGSSIAVTGTATNVNCYGDNTGAVSINITGGVSPYTYSWTGGATTKNISGKTAGVYTVTVTDAGNCSATQTFTITQPTAPLALNAALTHVSCNGGDNGSIDLGVNGGTGPYTYSWNLGGSNNNNSNCWNWWWWWCNNNCNNSSSSTTTQDVSDLSEGSYTVTVTDAKGCTTTGTYIITEPSVLTVSATKTNVTCKDGNNGTITLAVNGGTAPYSYNWGNNITTQNRNNLTAGNYSVTVTDAKGCNKTVSVSISQPNSGLNVSASVNNVTCKGSSTGDVNISVNGGTSPYTYSWTGGATSQDINNKPAGTYTVVITDNGGCSITKTYTITEPATALSLSAVVTNVSCKGGDNGAINLSVAGGSAPYSYSWNLGNSNNSNCYNWWSWWCNSNCNNNNNGTHSQDVNDLAEGTYSVTVTDANGCSASATYNVTEPAAALSVNVAKTNVTCKDANNGTITLNVTGGAAPYTYNWGGNVTSQNRNNLDAGTYNVTVTDANGCTKTVSATITEPSSGVTISSTVTNVSCNAGNNGGVNISVSGGSSPYTYSWTGGATTQDISNKTAGTYTVVVTDANGCSQSKTYTITQPSPITASISVSPMVTVTNGQPYTIYDGYGPQSVTLSVSVSGGNGGYTYSWSPANSCGNKYSASTSVSPNSTTTYTVTITDNKGCSKTVSQTIKVVDVRCGNNNNKVIVCHNGNELCVSENAVQAHLNHGCSVGPCSNNAKGGTVVEEEEDNHEEGIQSLVGKDIKVYPNPSNGIFLLELPQGIMNANVLITDVSGRIIERRVMMGANTIRFDLSNVAQGMYLIQVVSGNDKFQSRITIE